MQKSTFLLGGPLAYKLKRKKSKPKHKNNLKEQSVENEWIFHLNIRSIDYNFEELETHIDTFCENKPSSICLSETWMTESSDKNAYALESYAPMEFDPCSTRNEGVAIYVHESLAFELLEPNIQKDSIPDLNYTGVNCTARNREKFTVVCFYNSPSVNKQDFLDQFELLLESLSQIKNYYLIGDINIDLLECNPVADRYLKLLEIHGCAQGIEEPTRVTLDSESLTDHIIHNDYQRPLEFGVIKTYITDHFATYVDLNISKSKSIRSQHFIKDRTFLRDGKLSPLSTRTCFKYLRSFSSNLLLNQMHWQNLSAKSSKTIANLFNSFFSSIYGTSLSTSLPIPQNPEIFLRNFKINIYEVSELLLKASTSCRSSDPIPTFLLNRCPDILAPLVTQLFEMIIKTKEWLCLWKCSTITPIYKSDDPESVENYRPISILPQLSIILEKLIFRYIYSHVRKKICSEQHGFMRQRSTVTQLLPFLDELYNRKDSNIPSYAVYFDFRKAFDLVPHHLLLHKLADFGFDSDFLEFFQSYLSSRFQQVSVNGVLSQLSKVTSGVPQGSVVGPLFFIIFINDLPDNITKSSCYLFADDSKLLSGSIPDLQHDIVNFQIWATENLMCFNIDKCKSLYFDGRNKSSATVTLDGNEIPIVNCRKASNQRRAVQSFQCRFKPAIWKAGQCTHIWGGGGTK